MFYITVELVVKSYMPLNLEKGMIFIDPKNNMLWKLDRNIHPNEKDNFLVENGAPVEPYLVLIDDNGEQEIIATPDQIGWWDDGPGHDELRDIEIDDMNIILMFYDGKVDVQLETEPKDDDLIKDFILIAEGQVVLSAAPHPEDDDFDTSEWEDDSEG